MLKRIVEFPIWHHMGTHLAPYGNTSLQILSKFHNFEKLHYIYRICGEIKYKVNNYILYAFLLDFNP